MSKWFYISIAATLFIICNQSQADYAEELYFNYYYENSNCRIQTQQPTCGIADVRGTIVANCTTKIHFKMKTSTFETASIRGPFYSYRGPRAEKKAIKAAKHGLQLILDRWELAIPTCQ